MASPKPFVVPPPSTSRGSKLSYAQLRALWIQAGGNPDLASTMAAVALAESAGDPAAHNQNAKTKDDSYGLWQINYFGNLRKDRTQAFGPTSKITDPLTNARAAVALAGDGSGIAPNWTTFRTGAYQAFFRPQTPQERAANDAALAQAKASNPDYAAATANEAGAIAAAKSTAHITDPWVTVLYDKAGNPTGFGQPQYGASPPKNVLMIGGQPATQGLLNSTWGAVYDNIWQDYTGKVASAADIVNVLGKGLSSYALREQLASQPSFTQSPVYKATAPGLIQQAKDALGVAPPASFVKNAISQGWDAATTDAKLRALPAYKTGPAYKANLGQNQSQYESIYGTADKEAQSWLQHVTLNGWTPEAVGQALRSDPAYKYSPEYQAKAIGFLDAIGQITGTTPVAAPATPEAAQQQTAKSKVGGLAPVPLQISTVGG